VSATVGDVSAPRAAGSAGAGLSCEAGSVAAEEPGAPPTDVVDPLPLPGVLFAPELFVLEELCADEEVSPDVSA
jgi:hypothetical protein